MILSKLAVLDEPPEAWNSERLSRLHALLQEHFALFESFGHAH